MRSERCRDERVCRNDTGRWRHRRLEHSHHRFGQAGRQTVVHARAAPHLSGRVPGFGDDGLARDQTDAATSAVRKPRLARDRDDGELSVSVVERTEVVGGVAVGVRRVLEPQQRRLTGGDDTSRGEGESLGARHVVVDDSRVGGSEVDVVIGGVVDLDVLPAIGALVVGSELGHDQVAGGDLDDGLGLLGDERLGSHHAGRRFGKRRQDCRRGPGCRNLEVHAQVGAGTADGDEGARDLGIRDAQPNSATAPICHPGLAGDADDVVVGLGLGRGEVGAEVVDGLGEAVDGRGGVAQPEHERLARVDDGSGLDGQRHVRGPVVAVCVDVRQSDTVEIQVDRFGAQVVDLDELEIVIAHVVGSDLGDQEVRCLRRRCGRCGNHQGCGQNRGCGEERERTEQARRRGERHQQLSSGANPANLRGRCDHWRRRGEHTVTGG